MEPTTGSRTRMEPRRNCPTAMTSRMSQGASGVQTSSTVGHPAPASIHDQLTQARLCPGRTSLLHALSPTTSGLCLPSSKPFVLTLIFCLMLSAFSEHSLFPGFCSQLPAVKAMSLRDQESRLRAWCGTASPGSRFWKEAEPQNRDPGMLKRTGHVGATPALLVLSFNFPNLPGCQV